MPDLDAIATRLDAAAKNAYATPQIEEALRLDDAYEIQRLSLENRYRRGERRIGVKMGFTSRAKMAQMGVDEMIWGRLTDNMVIEDGGSTSFSTYVHPRAEPEVAFLLGKPLEGDVTMFEAGRAIDAVAPAIEVIDSRYENFKFSLTDVVADNSSSAGVVLGPLSQRPEDISNLGMILEVDGAAMQIGSSAAILGHPLRSLVAAARLVGERGERLEAGDVVMAGGATAAVALAPGQNIRLDAEGLGRVSFSMEA